MDNDTCKKMMKKVCCILWSLYRIEWWHLIRSKASKSFSSDIRPEGFPSSVNQINIFLNSNQDLKNKIKPHLTVNNEPLEAGWNFLTREFRLHK